MTRRTTTPPGRGRHRSSGFDATKGRSHDDRGDLEGGAETFDHDESERLLRGFLSKALFDAGLYCRADDRGDPVIQLAPPLTVDQAHFDEIEQILRAVLIDGMKVL